MDDKNLFGLPQAFINFVKEGKTLDWEIFEDYVEDEDTTFILIDELEKKKLNYRNFMDESDPNQGKEGYYPVEYVPLIKDSEALIWFPQLKCFGQYSAEEGEIFAFQDVTWEQFIQKHTVYLNALFQLDEIFDEEIEDTYQFYFSPYEHDLFVFIEV